MKAFFSFIIAIWVAIQTFFAGFFPDTDKKPDDTPSEEPIPVVHELEVNAVENDISFFCDTESKNGLVRFGVDNDTNLFAPNESVKVIIDCADASLYGTKAGISVKCANTSYSKTDEFTFADYESQYTFSFSSALNGIYEVRLSTADSNEYSFTVGIIPENTIASDSFYYGIQPYITRTALWGSAYKVSDKSTDDSIKAILDTAGYMGVNLVREDGVAWSAMQTSAYGDVSFTVQDALIGKVTDRGMKYNWILGNGTAEWSIADAYRENYDASLIWTYAPNEEYWKDYVTELASHYAANPGIIWEIWNEPNIAYFHGTQQEYFTLLNDTAAILKAANSSAYVYSGGLAYPEYATNSSYFTEFEKLINSGLLDNWGYHNHDGNDTYCDNVNTMLANAAAAGLTTAGINSESGSYGVNASLIARKALYTRATGATAFVSYAFRQADGAGDEVNNYAFFTDTLEPNDAVITYSTVIRFLGNAEFVKSEKLAGHSFCDKYTSGGHTVYVYYAFGETSNADAPAGATACYDMYGNAIALSDTITVSEYPIYVIV